MKLQKNSKQPFDQRVHKLQQKMQAEDIQCVLIENPLDLFYYTGLQLSCGRLLVHLENKQLFVDGRYIQAAQTALGSEASLEHSQSVSDFCKKHLVHSVAFDAAHTSYQRFLHFKKMEPIHFVPATTFFKNLRVIKDSAEIEKMKKSAALAWKGFEWIQKSLRTGITEKQIARGFEIFCLEEGAERLSFDPIIAFGKNGAMPHYHPQDVALKSGDAVLIDIGVVLDHYHSDMTRMVFHETKDPFVFSLYQTAQQAQQEALKHCRPGTTCGQLDTIARHFLKQKGVENLFIHGLGHGIGLETHEFPRLKEDGEDKDVVLEAGMVITIEPGLYVPDKGGVRYEDTIVITENGFTNFY